MSNIDPNIMGYGRLFGLDIPSYDVIKTRYTNTFGENEDSDSLGRSIDLRKVVGIGASPGYYGGPWVNNEEEATLQVYHRHMLYKKLTGGEVNRNYEDNICQNECSSAYHSHCSYGLCFCDPGYTQSTEHGCVPTHDIFFTNGSSKTVYEMPVSSVAWTCNVSDPLATETCVEHGDINSECGKSTYWDECQCRHGLSHDGETGLCLLYLDVDCSDFMYDSPSSPDLRNIARDVMTEKGKEPGKSLLTFLPKNLSKEEYREAFCRDVDVFSLALERKRIKFGFGDVMTVIGIAIGCMALLFCIGCCILCCCYKKIKDCIHSCLNPDPLRGMSDETRVMGVALAKLQDEMEDNDDRARAQAYRPVPTR